ncbi:DnaJ-domain-containing protein [Cylindrobasidium torrendii FP15055 ss-10]|uniref:DnaJ-domain-containing protein n=1 Tax=Cylindrobasidium torrendii FP15055 ss-10 TaxID=1314674 RepID=A0A0D7BPD6_9AGAR|nr:DnaJ-domain-containing protein [Cylindrobasidium torrendii FP15055 ss-10]
MSHQHVSVSEAYNIMGLSQGASLDTLKSTYKKIALRTHPDKNPNNPAATAEFQKVTQAYDVLQRHLDHDAYSDDEEYDDYYDDEDEEERMAFYMYLFESFMGSGRRASPFGFGGRPRYSPFGGGGSSGYSPFDGPPHGYGPEYEEIHETPEQYTERIRKTREEQEAAERRRKQDAALLKLRKQEDRQRERQQAEQRKQDAAKAKKATGEMQKKQAKAKVANAKQASQKKRSQVFAAARAGKVDQVKKGIWEDQVDATGGEILLGCDEYVATRPKDPKETLLHIASQKGDVDMVEWLQTHNADDEQTRNGNGFTPFHVAVENGHVGVVKYFLDNFDPKDEDGVGVFEVPDKSSILRLALLSHEPEVVYMVLNSSLADSSELNACWTWITSSDGQAQVNKRAGADTGLHREKFEDMLKLLRRFGGFSPAATDYERPRKPAQINAASQQAQRVPSKSASQQQSQHAGARGKRRGRGKA